MNLNWTKAKAKYEEIINRNGVSLQWLQRVTSGSSAYDTGSADTYGYGDSITYYVTGSCKALVEHISAKDVVIPAGFYEEDFDKIYVLTDTDLEQFDQVIYPSGSGEKYLVLSRHVQRMGENIIISKFAIIRRLVPKSKGVY